MRPKIFVSSSTEGLEVARIVKEHLNEWADCSLWTDPDIFIASTTIIESIERALPLFPYAVFVMTPDDSAVIRKKQYLVPRDNLLFEFGLFAGRHGRRSIFIVGPCEIKLPTDLAGVITCQYKVVPGSGVTVPTYDVSEAGMKIREGVRLAETERAEPSTSHFWDTLSDEAVILFGLEQLSDHSLGVHPRISPRDLEAAQTISGFLGRRYPRTRVQTIPASSAGWQIFSRKGLTSI